MLPATALRAQLAARFPVPFTICERPRRTTLLTGIPPIDAASGGIPVSALSEICGPGKTSVLNALLAGATQEHYCALVDARDCFDPASAAAAGADLSRLLWVRCGKSKQKLPPLEQAFKAADILLHSGGFGLVAVDLGDFPERLLNRIPAATWFRFAKVVERQRSALLFLEQHSHSRSCAGLVINMKTRSPWGPGNLLTEIKLEAEVVRSSEKKFPSSVRPAFFLKTEWA